MHMRIMSLAAFLVAACGSSQSADTTPAAAPEPAAEPAAAEPAAAPTAPTTSAADEATRGATLYGAKCAGCHGDAGQGGKKAPPVVGKDALPLEPRSGSKRQGQFKTALDVLSYVKTTMPGDDPGSLEDGEYRAIVAFDLKANGVDLTGKDVSDQTLAGIALH